MSLKQAVTRVEQSQYDLFKETTARIGTTPADALRMFIYAFNENRGFPYQPRSRVTAPAPYQTEDEATDELYRLGMEALDETW